MLSTARSPFGALSGPYWNHRNWLLWIVSGWHAAQPEGSPIQAYFTSTPWIGPCWCHPQLELQKVPPWTSEELRTM